MAKGQIHMKTKTVRFFLITFCLLAITFIMGELRPDPALIKEKSTADITIYVTDLGYHAGLVIPTKAMTARIDLQQLQEASAHFPGTDWIEIGWGDKAFYQAGSWQEISIKTMTRAALRPTPSIIHLVGFNGHPPTIFAHNNVMELKISESGLRALLSSIEASFAIPQDYVAPVGLYGNSRFFPAHGSYHMFNICNHWTARQLREAGIATNLVLATWSGLLHLDLEKRSSGHLWKARPFVNLPGNSDK